MNKFPSIGLIFALAMPLVRGGVANVEPTPAPPAHEVPPPPQEPRPLPISPAPAGDAPQPPSTNAAKEPPPAPGSTIVVHPKVDQPGNLARN